MVGQNGVGERRRTRSLVERKRIVEEALAPGASVAAVGRRHGLNSNLVFKWIRRSREGWRDRRREPANVKLGAIAARVKPGAIAAREMLGPAFVPVKLLASDAASPPAAEVVAKPAREARRSARRGVMGISLPNGAKVSLDAEVDAEALRRVLSALGVT